MFKKTTKGAGTGISAAEFAVAAAVLLLLEAVSLFQFVVRPQMTAAAVKAARLAESRIALDEFRANERDAEQRKAVLDGLLAQITAAETMLPPALHNEDISIDIGRYAEANNIKLDSIAFQSRRLVDPSDYATENTVPFDALSGLSSTTSPATSPVMSANGGTTADSASDVADSAAVGADSSAVVERSEDGERSLSLQGVQVAFSSEFHTAGPFISMFEDGARKVRIRDVSLSRVQEGELKGVINLEYAALSPSAEQQTPGIYAAGADGGILTADGLTPEEPAPASGDSGGVGNPDGVNAADSDNASGGVGVKSSIFEKYAGYVEEGADPTILLLSSQDDVDADFYMILNSSTSSDTKVSYGVYPRVETEVRSNVNNAIRGKLTISGNQDQFEYTYSLASYQKSDKRRLNATDGRLRLKILSCVRNGDDDNVAILLDVENNTDIPVEVIVVNDDVMDPRVVLGTTVGTVEVTTR